MRPERVGEIVGSVINKRLEGVADMIGEMRLQLVELQARVDQLEGQLVERQQNARSQGDGHYEAAP